MHIDTAAIKLLAMPGYRLTQLIARQHAARIPYEYNEQRRLRSGQRYLASVRVHKGPTGQVDPAALDAQSSRFRCGVFFPRRSDHLSEAAEKLLFIQWLRWMGV